MEDAMPETTPSLDDWRRLYQAAGRLKETAPWQWMEEVDIFGVQDPETGELGFVSIMGLLGEHYALALYRGAEGLSRFWDYQEAASTMPPEELLNIPNMQASFEDRGELFDRDRAQIKELGLKYRGRNAWPMFRDYSPGYCPWYLEPAQVRFLTHATEQAVEVALRFKQDRIVVNLPDEDTYLVRVPRQEAGALVWEDQVMAIPYVEPEGIRIVIDRGALEAARRLPRSGLKLEADLFMFPGCIGERGERPYYAYNLLVVESQRGLIIGTELLDPRPGLAAMRGLAAPKLLALLIALGRLPARVAVANELLFHLLQPLGAELGFQVGVGPVPALDEAKESMIGRLLGRR